MPALKIFDRVSMTFTLSLILGLSASASGLRADDPKAQEGAKPRSPAETARLQQALKDTDLGKHWIYDDLATAVTQARKAGKPLLVVFR